MMVFQLANDGNLEEYLRQNANTLMWRKRIRFSIEITKGLAHIHSQDVLHRDLHPGNILILGGRALLADFGCSRVGKFRYGAPEMLRHQRDHVYDKRCDVYSLGAVFWYISSGRAPFFNVAQWRGIGMVCDGKREEPVPGTPEAYAQLYSE